MKRRVGFSAGQCLLVAGLCLLAAGLCSAWSGIAAAQEASSSPTPTVEGAISAIASAADFYVDGKHVVTNAQTTFWKHIVQNGDDAMVTDPGIAKNLAIGDNVQVFGNNDRHTHSIIASEVRLQPSTNDHPAGYAVVQKVVATSPQLILEADGYNIVITPKTILHNKAPLTAQTVPVVNMWIAYSGRWSKDGLVVAEHAAYSPFLLSPRMKKGLEKSEGKVVAPMDGAKAGESRKDGEIQAPYLYGKKHTASIPADAALQQRVRKIGERLIPASQKILAKGDPQKIDFRFYAVQMSTPQVIGSPDGIVIIPVQMIEKLQNDDQVAALLSQGVAEALEWLVPPAATGNSGPAMVALGEMPFVGPVAGIALISSGLFEMKHGTYPSRLDPSKSARVGLSLMHDAGYDILQAPLASQILRYGDAKPGEKPPTLQSAYLLKIIGLEYTHDTSASSGKGQTIAQ